MSKFLTLSQAVEAHVRDGDSVAMEGFTHLIPNAAAHEIIRQKRKHLTLIRMTPDIAYDQLIGMGCADKVVFSWGGNPGVGSLHRLRDAVENGWPNRLAIEEHSHAAMANAYEAGAANLPFAMLRGYIGADLPKVNPNIKSITCPFTGETLAAVPAIRPDVSIIHALKADRAGNVYLEGIVGVQKEAVLAAKRSIVTVEEIVDDFGPRNANAVILPSWTVSAVALVPGGAHPSYAHGYYKRDNAYYIAWDPIARERDTFLAWMKANVLEKGPEVFAEIVKPLREKQGLVKTIAKAAAKLLKSKPAAKASAKPAPKPLSKVKASAAKPGKAKASTKKASSAKKASKAKAKAKSKGTPKTTVRKTARKKGR
jgi:glutaconate CoA-transferase subunit A